MPSEKNAAARTVETNNSGKKKNMIVEEKVTHLISFFFSLSLSLVTCRFFFYPAVILSAAVKLEKIQDILTSKIMQNPRVFINDF